ncbi:hypothetical protein AB7M17_004635 [Bradyrhizobium sp. USDA 377]
MSYALQAQELAEKCDAQGNVQDRVHRGIKDNAI